MSSPSVQSSHSKKKSGNSKGPVAKKRRKESSSDADHTEYAVEAIIKHKGRAGHRQMLVRWSGFGEEGDTWEYETDLREDIPHKVSAYLKRRKIEPVILEYWK
jgi:hypothetical protein